MKKVFILDVDGVLVGTERGRNFPDPSVEVLAGLSELKKSGHHICLCTGKPLMGALSIVEAAELDDPHITDFGIVVSNPCRNELIRVAILPSSELATVQEVLLEEKIYFELYTQDDFFIESKSDGEHSRMHAEILQRKPLQLSSFEELEEQAIIKLFLVVDGPEQRDLLDSLIRPLLSDIELNWTINPNALPAQYGWLSAKTASKAAGVREVSEYLGVPLSEFLAVGDHLSDWQFMEQCGIAMTLMNASPEMQRLVLEKSDLCRVLPDVNQDGILELFADYSK